MESSKVLSDIQPAEHQSGAPIASGGLLQDTVVPVQSALELVIRLCEALEEENIVYCHWKSNNAIDRSASGDNDLDLLVSRTDATRFSRVLSRLGFKQVRAPADKQMIGVLDYFGYDRPADKWVHVHAHFQLVMGHDTTKNFRLAIERAYLESATRNNLFRVPAPEFEFIVFVMRMILKHSTWDAILGREGNLSSRERKELAFLQPQISKDYVREILKYHLPFISFDLFQDCVKALQPGCSFWVRVKASQELLTRLEANAVHPVPMDTLLKFWRRVTQALRWRLFNSSSKYFPEVGGAMIALVGGDGAGKSTAIDTLYDWLSKIFEISRVHMGRPAWSPTTVAIRSILKIGQILGLYPLETSLEETVVQQSRISPGFPYLIREVCLARDRYWKYVKARRFAARGGVVLFDRFPLDQIHLMDGPQARRFTRELENGPAAKLPFSPKMTSRLAQFLIDREEYYYHRIAFPDLVAVLRLNPETAVERKTEERPAAVHRRSSEIWQIDWDQTAVHVIDASRSKAEVASELQSRIWSLL